VELRHVRYFVAVAEELHFGKAAEKLHLAQPPLSRQIRQLEHELGVELFTRTKRRVALTHAGTVFLDEGRRLLADAEHAALAARKAALGETGSLSIGFVSSTAYVFLPRILRAFRDRFPGVDLALHEMTSGEQRDALLEKRIQVGFVRPAMPLPTLQHELVLSENVIAALPAGHRLADIAAGDAIPLALFAEEPFVLFRRLPAPSFGEQTVAFCAEAGFAPHVAQEAREMSTALSLVAVGMGVALVPETAQAIPWPGVVYRAVKDPTPQTELMMVYRKAEASPIVDAFRQIVKESANGGY